MSKTFLYFAYGSNMLKQRIHINNPTAVRKNIGYLKNFRLDFATYSHRWHGCSATIVPTENSNVWGVVWELAVSNIATLDDQEGVADKIYFPDTVDINTPEGEVLNCRVYQQWNQPTEHKELHALEDNRRPSPLYIDTIIKGALENEIPADYVKLLKSIQHNGYEGEYNIKIRL